MVGLELDGMSTEEMPPESSEPKEEEDMEMSGDEDAHMAFEAFEKKDPEAFAEAIRNIVNKK